MSAKRTQINSAPCRAMLHAWQCTNSVREGRGFVVTFRCIRCGLQKEETLNSRGLVVKGPKYSGYPDGYLEPGSGRVTRERKGAYRLLLIEPISHKTEDS